MRRDLSNNVCKSACKGSCPLPSSCTCLYYKLCSGSQSAWQYQLPCRCSRGVQTLHLTGTSTWCGFGVSVESGLVHTWTQEYVPVVSNLLVASLRRTVTFRLRDAVVGRLTYTPSRNQVSPALISCKSTPRSMLVVVVMRHGHKANRHAEGSGCSKH